MIDYDNFIMKLMADAVYYGIRLYVCLEEKTPADAAAVRRKIADQIHKDLPYFPYNP